MAVARHHNLMPVTDAVRYHASVRPEKLALQDIASGREYTYRQMHERIGRLAAFLKGKGIGPGSRVAFLALNSTDVLEIFYAAWRIGASVLALNYRLTASELEFIINDATPKMLFYDKVFEGVVTELEGLVDIEQYIETDGLGGPSAYEQALSGADDMILDMVDQPLCKECMLMYSSGTTGRPKGVIITHEMIFYSWVNGVSALEGSASAVWLSVMPLFHIGGLNVSSLPALWMGATVLVAREFDVGEMLAIINRKTLAPTHTIFVPAMFNAMRQHPLVAQTDFSRLGCALAGGAAVPAELIRWWYKHGLVIREGYGMTESAASNCALSREEIPDHIGTCGRAMMFTEMRIVGSDGTEVEQGDAGEIWMRGPTITPGYWNNKEANAASFVDGWFKSGDIARQDSEGRFIIEDRAKDMYISGGENVYPAEVEAVLYELDAILEVAVIGVPDDRWGETGCVVAVLKDGASLSFDELLRHCGKKLGRFKHPAYLVFMEALPRNTTGKVKKFELREMAPELLMRQTG